MSNIIVPAAPDFYALFLCPEALPIPRQFFRHAVAAWQIHRTEIDGEDYTSVIPVCVSEYGGGFDFILNPNGSLVHVTGFTCNEVEVALAYALDQEEMGKPAESKRVEDDATATRQ